MSRRYISAQVGYEYPQQPYYLDPELSMLFPAGPVVPSIKAQRGVNYGAPSQGYGVALTGIAAALGIGVQLWNAKTNADIKKANAIAYQKALQEKAEADAADQAMHAKNMPYYVVGGVAAFGVFGMMFKAVLQSGKK